jgi:hypothetical protein
MDEVPVIRILFDFTFATLFNFMLVLSLVVHVTVFAQHQS